MFPLEHLPVAGAHHSEHVEPAERFRYADGIGDVGVIASVTEPFCEQCDRIRITAEGKFRTCLFALDEFDLRAILRGDAPTTSSTTGWPTRSCAPSAPSGPVTASARSTSSARPLDEPDRRLAQLLRRSPAHSV